MTMLLSTTISGETRSSPNPEVIDALNYLRMGGQSKAYNELEPRLQQLFSKSKNCTVVDGPTTYGMYGANAKDAVITFHLSNVKWSSARYSEFQGRIPLTELIIPCRATCQTFSDAENSDFSLRFIDAAKARPKEKAGTLMANMFNPNQLYFLTTPGDEKVGLAIKALAEMCEPKHK